MNRVFKGFSGLLFIMILSLSLMAGCGGGGGGGGSSNNATTQDTIIPSTSTVIDDTTTQTLSSVSSDGSTLTFSQNSSQLQSLSSGSVITVGVTDASPYGLLRKVSSVSVVDNQVIVETTQASLTDAIQKGRGEITQTLTQSNLKTATSLKKGVTLRKNNTAKAVFIKNKAVSSTVEVLEWSYDLSNVVLYDDDGKEATTYDQVTATGSISFDLGFNFIADIDNFTLKELTFKEIATEKAEITVGSTASYTLNKEIEIAKLEFTPIVVWVGYLPVYITPIATVKVGTNGSVSVGLSAGATQQAVLTAGLSYTNEAWSPINEFTNEFSYTPPTLSAAANIKVYGGPQLDLMIYSVVGPYINVYDYVKLDADISDNPWWTLTGGIESVAGIYLEIFDRKIADYSAKVIDYGVTLATASGPIVDTTSPSAPTDLAATAASTTQINLSWNVSTDNVGIAGYNIYRDGSYIKASTTNSATDTELSPNTRYCYVITAYDAAWNESAQSSQVCATTSSLPDTTAPSVPASLVATAASTSQINLTWTASPESDVAGYKVYKNGTYLKTVTYALTSDTGLSASTQYCYTVSAYDATGNESNKSTQACATTSTIPDTTPPTVLSTSPVNNATGVAINTTITATFSEAMTASTVSTATFTLNNGVTGVVTYTGTTATFTPLSNLAASTTYTATITTGVKDAAGNAMAAAYTWIFTTAAVPGSAPFAPTGVSTIPENGQATISWNAVSDATSYSLYWSTSSGVSKSSGTKISNATSPYLHTGITNGTTYYYVVTAVNSYGESVESSQVSATPNTTQAATGRIPDTNQTTSYTSTFGEDHDYTINPPSYTDNGDGTITDNVTGLVWQKQDDGTARTWDDAGAYCDASTLGGYSDWRLPSRMELLSIADYGSYNPAINATYFPGTSSSYYWSSTTDVGYTSYAWGVGFGYLANTSYSLKTNSKYVRCVRGGQATPSLTDNGNETVTDSVTLLTWQQGENSAMTWETALSYCEALSLAWATDWRLPNIKELSSIVDDTRQNPAINTTLFPNAISSYYWSSTTNAYSTSYAWVVFSGTGGAFSGLPNYYGGKTYSHYVRCVRGGQPEVAQTGDF